MKYLLLILLIGCGTEEYESSIETKIGDHVSETHQVEPQPEEKEKTVNEALEEMAQAGRDIDRVLEKEDPTIYCEDLEDYEIEELEEDCEESDQFTK